MQPLETTERERRQPESPVAIVASEPPRFVLRASPFDEGRWAEGVWRDLAAGETLLLGKAAPVLEGGALVCAFVVRPSPGIDGIDGPTGPIVSSSTPDLIVWAELGGAKFNKGPRLGSLSGTFVFRATLRTGDPIVFTFGDYDFLSNNDYVGRIEGKYAGKVPFELHGKAGAAECRAASGERLAAEGRAAAQRLEAALAAFEAHRPTIEDAVLPEQTKTIEAELGALTYFTGSAEPALGGAQRRVEEATKKQWSAYVAKLQELHERAAAPGEWVNVDGLAEVRSSGLYCQRGKYVVAMCMPEIEVRLLKDPAGALCPVGGSALGALGPISVYRADGATTSVSLNNVWIGERAIHEDTELYQLPKGTVLRLPLFLGGTFYRKDHVGWDIPLLQVGKKFLRIY